MKIAMFTTRRLLSCDASDTRYVYESLRPHFSVDVFDRPDANLCRGAHVVFTRFPLPVDRAFLSDLTRYCDKLIINNPTAQLHHSKHHLLDFPAITPPTIISADHMRIREFAQVYGTVVFKPLDRHKGQGVTKVDANTLTRDQFRVFVTDYVTEFGVPVVQRFIAEVAKLGDKRINIINYEPISAVVTYPASGSFICHEAAGGHVEAATITDVDRGIVQTVMPFLRANRIFWAALDIIGPYLGEINLLTPAMVLRADRAHNTRDGVEAIVNALHAYQEEIHES